MDDVHWRVWIFLKIGTDKQVITTNELELVKESLIKESTDQVGEEQRNCYTFPGKWTFVFWDIMDKTVEFKYFK